MKKIEVDNQTLGEAIIDILRVGQQATFTVKGSSMMPFFKDGQTVVNLVQKDDYQKGDIIFFSYQNRFILHRIKQIFNNSIITSGDNVSTHEMISIENIFGYVQSFKTGHQTINTHSLFYRFKYHIWLWIKPLYLKVRRR